VHLTILQNHGKPNFNIPLSVTTPIIFIAPIILPASSARGEDLEVRVSAPATGDHLPIIIFAHGYGKSLDEYAPLVNFWAAHGFESKLH
jgi:predicted dienelactone hydrolase